MDQVIIEDATEADIPYILHIAERLKLGEGSTEHGFLAAHFDRKDYELFLRGAKNPAKNVFLTVAREIKGGPCIGFLFAYNQNHIKRPLGERPNWPPGGSEASIVDLISPSTYLLLGFKKTTFFVIKQIAIDPDFMHRRVAQSLYANLFRRTTVDYFFAAIITEPKNTRSETFHRRQGFVPIMQCFSVSKAVDGGESEYINRVWFKPALPRGVQQYSPAAAGTENEPKAAPSPSDINGLMKTNFEHAQRLYLHEDNLNWSKMRMLLTVATALVGGTVYFANAGNKLHPAFFDAFIIFGTVVVLFISVTLESGLYFMHAHKQALRILEAQMRLTFSDFVPLLWKVPTKSSTTWIIRRAIYVVLGIWLAYVLWQAYQIF